MAGVLGWGGKPLALPGRFALLLVTALTTGSVTPEGPAPVPAGPLGPLDITTRLLIGSTRTGVACHYVESFGPGQVAAGRHIYGTLDDGTIVRVQMSAINYWSDGSVRTAKLTLTIPGPRVAGTKVNVRLRTNPGEQDATPCMTLAQLAARTNFRTLHFGHDFGVEQYELRLNDLIAAGVGGWSPAQSGTNYPTSRIEIISSGPESLEIMAEAYVKRVGDGATHKTYLARLYVTYFKGSDGFNVLTEWEQPNSYDGLPDAVATAGPAKPQRIAGIIETFDGDTFLHACGGPRDWRATTVPASNFNSASGLLTYPSGARMGFTRSNGVAWGFSPDAGAALPAGVSGNEVYYPGYLSTDRTKGPLWRFRASVATDNGQPTPPAFSATATYSAGTIVSANGGFYICRTGGAAGSGATGPSGMGTSLTDGSAAGVTRWENVSAVFGAAGSGTIKMYPLAHSFAGSGGTGWTREMRPVWVGAGAQPWVQVGLDFAHAFRVTRNLPPMDYEGAAGLHPASGTLPDYELGMVSQQVVWAIEAPGDSATADRIGPVPFSHARAVLQWDNPVAHQTALAFAGSMCDFQNRFRDERSGQMIITSRGPAADGVTYPGHAPVNSTIHITTKASSSGNPADASGSPAFAKGFPKFSGKFFRDDAGYHYEYGDLGGAAHMPNAWQVPYILTGHAAWLHYGEVNLNVNVCQTGWRGPTLSPNQDTTLGRFAPAVIGQPRGTAWVMREVTNFEMLAPSNHPAMPFVRDIITQNIGFYKANSEKGHQSHLGIVTWTPTPTHDAYAGRPYHMAMMYYVFALMHWRDRDMEWGTGLGAILNVMDR